jgi:hypothetical protein
MEAILSVRSFKQLLVGVSLLACTSAFATPFTFDVAGARGVGEFGNAGNDVYEINVGANATITSVSFDVNLTAFPPSFLSEMFLAFTNSSATRGGNLQPGVDVNAAGTQTFTGMEDLVADDFIFSVDADGILRLEFYESFDDESVSPDGVWNFGTITFNTDAGEVPEPATGMLIGAGLALMACTTRRRRTAVKIAA